MLIVLLFPANFIALPISMAIGPRLPISEDFQPYVWIWLAIPLQTYLVYAVSEKIINFKNRRRKV